MRGMLIERQPSASLAPYVEKLWYCEQYAAVPRKERVLPNGRFQLVMNLSDSFTRPRDCPPEEWGQVSSASVVVGMQSHFRVIHTATLQSVIGVVFCAGGARAFFDAPADAFYNQNVPLDLVWGSKAGELRSRLREASPSAHKFRVLEMALLQRMAKRLELHAAVQYAVKEFSKAPRIRKVLDVTREASLSRRRFAQLFREQVGLTPKLYCRLHRFQNVLQQITSGAPVDWADVALACGYCDQAHLAHEFRDFSGISPGAYATSERPFVNHVAMD